MGSRGLWDSDSWTFRCPESRGRAENGVRAQEGNSIFPGAGVEVGRRGAWACPIGVIVLSLAEADLVAAVAGSAGRPSTGELNLGSVVKCLLHSFPWQIFDEDSPWF